MARRFFKRLANRVQLNFTLDGLLSAVFVMAGVSGLVNWLFLPDGGYQGGRNHFYQAALLGLTRHQWQDLHLWTGLAMIAVLGVHLILHWHWAVCKAKRNTNIHAY